MKSESHVCALDDGAFYVMHHLFSYLHTNLSCQHIHVCNRKVEPIVGNSLSASGWWKVL